jgi:ring-1,2-phenylacetyl-CoA epoxidase subunit PaaE
MSTPHFHSLTIQSLEPLTPEAVQIRFAVPLELVAQYAFQPGQFLTLRAHPGGQELRRSYSICSTPQQLAEQHQICVGIKRVDGGAFSTWATQTLRTGQSLDVMPPDGRFVSRAAAAGSAQSAGLHRLGIAAGSGITPILSIASHTLASEAASRFTLVYGNRNMQSIMFSEELQDLKDRYPSRLQLVHILSRQASDVALNNGRIDADKLAELMPSVIDPRSVDEAFICGPEGLIEAAEQALRQAGLAPERIHCERFASAGTTKSIASRPDSARAEGQKDLKYKLSVIVDGKAHTMQLGDEHTILDTALQAGLDLPYACKGGVCCTCRAKVLQGSVSMDKNYTLEPQEIAQGFVLTCQARCTSPQVTVSYDER